MPVGVYIRTKEHNEAISRAKKGHRLSRATKDKIGDANRRQVYFSCEYCGNQSSDRPSHYKRKKRHFCSTKCYSLFRKEKLSIYEQPAYKGIFQGDKQVYHRRYVKRAPECISHLKARRYARERNAEGSHTLEEWQILKIKFNYKCAICGGKKPLTKDHIVPLSKGGTDHIQNIQPLCRNCNSRKWMKMTSVRGE